LGPGTIWEAYNEEQTYRYIDWQVQTASGQKEIFPWATQKAMFRRSRGIPRMINRLALESLHQGCLEGAQVITFFFISRCFLHDTHTSSFSSKIYPHRPISIQPLLEKLIISFYHPITSVLLMSINFLA
jgi:hypothetical protein